MSRLNYSTSTYTYTEYKYNTCQVRTSRRGCCLLPGPLPDHRDRRELRTPRGELEGKLPQEMTSTAPRAHRADRKLQREDRALQRDWPAPNVTFWPRCGASRLTLNRATSSQHRRSVACSTARWKKSIGGGAEHHLLITSSLRPSPSFDERGRPQDREISNVDRERHWMGRREKYLGRSERLPGRPFPRAVEVELHWEALMKWDGNE